MALFPTLESLLPKNLATGSTLVQVVVALRSLVKTFSGSFTLKATDFNDQVVIEKDAASGFNPALTIKNDNSGASASASIRVETSGGGSGDPFVVFTNGTTTWAVGLDNSAADTFVIAQSAALGGADAVRIDATNALQVLGKLLLYAATAQAITLTHAATAPRTVTLQDLDGSVALLGITPTAPPNAGDLLWVDALYDIGRLLPTPLRPRDLYLARNAAVGGTLTVTGLATVNGAPIALAPLVAQMTGADQTLTTTMTDNPGCFLTLTPGNWRVRGIWSFNHTAAGAGDVGNVARGQIVLTGGTATASPAAGTTFAYHGFLSGSVVNSWSSATQDWNVAVTVATVVKLQADKTGGAGTCLVRTLNTAIFAEYLGRP